MIFLYGNWRQLSLPTRLKIAELFNIKRVRYTHVSNNEVVDDGFDVKDIEESLNIDKLQNYLDTGETDMGILWGWMVDKVEGREVNIPMKDIKKGEIEVFKSEIFPGAELTAIVPKKKHAKAKSKQK